MSIQVHTSDNLSIVAGKGKRILDDILSNKVENYQDTLTLHISILINGKIKNIFQSYQVNNNPLVEGDTNYRLEEYHSFNTLCDILKDLGYNTSGFYPMLEKAIEKLFKD